MFLSSPSSAGLVTNTVTFTLEAQEDPSDGASCPWVFTWDGSGYVKDNDIYSVARYQTGEYEDYYVLQKTLLPQNNSYTLEIREIASEDSWTDSTGLFAVDHAADVMVGVDDKGNVFSYRPEDLIVPVLAVSNSGADIAGILSAKDGAGFAAYSEDYAEVDFGNVDVSSGARVVLRVKGFVTGIGKDHPFIGPPAIVIQALVNSTWQEIGRLKPRFDWAEGVFDLSEYLPDMNSKKIRLYSISHGTKYHIVDFVGLSVGPQPFMDIKELSLASATFNGNDVLDTLLSSDSNYLKMTTGEKFAVSYMAEPQSLEKRDFIFISKGYYIPKGNTYYVYTWNGTDWVIRDSYSFAVTDEQHDFNLSAYLPDPDGKYRVRVYHSYGWGAGAIDFASLKVNGTLRQMSAATDLRNSGDILSLVESSDDVRLIYPPFYDTGVYNRWTEYEWTVPTPPDLTGSWMTLYSLSRGKNITGMVRAQNTGSGNAGSFKVAFYLSNNGTTLGSLLNTYTVAGLNAGMSKTIPFSYVSNISLTGKYIISVIDSSGAISETNEANNRTARRIP